MVAVAAAYKPERGDDMRLEEFLELSTGEQILALSKMSIKERIALKDDLRKQSFANIGPAQMAIYKQQNDPLIRINNNLASAGQHLESAKEHLDNINKEKGNE